MQAMSKTIFQTGQRSEIMKKLLKKSNVLKFLLEGYQSKDTIRTFTTVETKAADKEICKLLKEEAINRSFHEQGAMHLRNYYDHQQTTRAIG